MAVLFFAPGSRAFADAYTAALEAQYGPLPWCREVAEALNTVLSPEFGAAPAQPEPDKG